MSMIIIDNDEHFSLHSEISEQFKLFSDEGKLPSFSVLLNLANGSLISSLTVNKIIGDYVFFEERPEGFWILFGDTYACITKDFKKVSVYVSSNEKNRNYEISYIIMQAYMYRLISTGNFMIHSAAVVYRGEGIAFCGLSGAGKSTQANLWKKYLDCSILNYDKPCVINELENVYIHGSPWSGKERLLLNKYVPLKAIAFVVKSKDNHVRRLKPAEAVSHVFLHNYVFPFTQEIEMQYFNAIKFMVEKIPVFELNCDISEKAVEVLFNNIFEKATYNNAKKEFIMKYKVKDGFIMKNIADEYVVIPRGTQAIEINASMVFNESGAFLWKKLSYFIDEDTLVDKKKKKYFIDEMLAKKDVRAFLEKLDINGLIEKIEE